MLISYSVVLMKPKLPHQGQRGGGGRGLGIIQSKKNNNNIMIRHLNNIFISSYAEQALFYRNNYMLTINWTGGLYHLKPQNPLHRPHHQGPRTNLNSWSLTKHIRHTCNLEDCFVKSLRTSNNKKDPNRKRESNKTTIIFKARTPESFLSNIMHFRNTL